jgi:hypothetical protein
MIVERLACLGEQIVEHVAHREYGRPRHRRGSGRRRPAGSCRPAWPLFRRGPPPRPAARGGARR